MLLVGGFFPLGKENKSTYYMLFLFFNSAIQILTDLTKSCLYILTTKGELFLLQRAGEDSTWAECFLQLVLNTGSFLFEYVPSPISIEVNNWKSSLVIWCHIWLNCLGCKQNQSFLFILNCRIILKLLLWSLSQACQSASAVLLQFWKVNSVLSDKGYLNFVS